MMRSMARLVVMLSLAASMPTELALPLSSPPESIAIVVNRSNPLESLTFSELREIFLGDRGHWKDGKRITIVMREPGEPERKAILHTVCSMEEEQYKNHILHGLFTGEILLSPKILSTPNGVRRFLFNVPGAIGYLRMNDVDDSVKIVRIDNLMPGDKGYKIRLMTMAGN